MADDDLTFAQREALRSLRATRGGCPPAEALVEYAGLADGERVRAPIHDHVQVCSRCQLVLLNLDERQAAASGWTARWALPVAAALALAVAAPLVYRTLTSPPAGTGVETVRGAELQPMTPVGDVSAVGVFEWQSPMRAAKYRVTVFRGSEIVWVGESTETRIPAPATLPIEPGAEYAWQVDALDAEGSIRMSSPRIEFTRTR